MSKAYYVYITTNPGQSVLYTGVTNDLQRRMLEHRNKLNESFTKRYNIQKLLYYEIFNTPEEAILSEKKIKGWTREKKLDLIREKNPNFDDLILSF